MKGKVKRPRHRINENLCHERIKSLRMAKGLTLEAFAEKLQQEGISIQKQHLSLIERNERCINCVTLHYICKVLGSNPNYMMGWE